MTGDDTVGINEEKLEAIRWRIRLSDKAPGKTIVIGIAGLVAFLVGAILFKNIVLGLVGFAIIFGSTAEFWLGTSFSIDQKGATVRTGFSPTAIEWGNVKRVIRDSNGIRLSPLEQPSTMDAFRGVYLRYGKDNRDSIERAILKFGKFSDNNVVDRADGRGDGDSDPKGSG